MRDVLDQNQRLAKSGKPRKRKPRKWASARDRFWSKVDRKDDGACWLWTAGRFTSGYGVFHAGSRAVAASRAAWEFEKGPIPTGLHVLHTCDVRLCVNPEHLFLGTNADNVADRQAKGRHRCGVGVRNNHAKLCPFSVDLVRSSALPGVALAALFGVTAAAICAVRCGRNWKQVGFIQPRQRGAAAAGVLTKLLLNSVVLSA